MDVRYYVDDQGRSPVTRWIYKLRDKARRTRILSHIAKMELGNFGDSKPVGDGVSELRIHFGQGYRVYYSRQGNEIILLLCAGDKSTQTQDVANAKAYLKNYKERSKDDEKERS